MLVLSLGAAISACKKDDEADPKPTADFTFVTGTCQTDCPVTFTNTSQNATSYVWDFGDGTTGAQTGTFVHTYANPGTYQVKLDATGAGGTTSVTKSVVVGQGTTCNYTVVNVTTNVTTPTTWESCKIYVVDNISVTNTLTIEPGAIVKMKSGARLTTNTGGTIIAQGTAADPVIFTSYKDDASGGDTNGDGPGTQPQAKDWHSVLINGDNGSVFKHCKFMYGGSAQSVLTLSTRSATVENSTFAHNFGGQPLFKGALDASEAASGTIIRNNIFYANVMPLHINNNYSLDASNTFHNPADQGQKNTHNGIWVSGAQSPGNFNWAETEVPYVVHFGLNFGSIFTIAPGVIIKNMEDSRIQLSSNAKLLAEGTSAQPIVFTSYTDDTYGGDTNADGTATTPAPRGWRDILLNATNGSVFDHCIFRYGGNGLGQTLSMHNSASTVRNSTFAYNYGGGTVESRAVLDASTTSNGTVIQNNVFYGNVRPLSIASSIDLDDSNTFHNPNNTSERNDYDAIVVNWSNNFTKQNVVWRETEVAYTTDSDIDIATGNTLELGNGVVIKFGPDTRITLRDSPAQIINSTGTGVAYTSIKDDTRGGDSNGNGNANSPAANDWDGIYHDTVPGVWVQWPNKYYAGH